jgi:hypothetical protein
MTIRRDEQRWYSGVLIEIALAGSERNTSSAYDKPASFFIPQVLGDQESDLFFSMWHILSSTPRIAG